MTDERKDAPPRPEPRSDAEGRRRPYVAPALIVYGAVGKLTQTGGVTTMDFGSMRRMCL
jgi:hypothetical protein